MELEQQNDHKVIQMFSNPTTTTLGSIYYDFGSEINLAPGEIILLSIPEKMRHLAVAQIAMLHRQDERLNTRRDRHPGLLSVLVHTPSDSSWRYWGGHSSGKWGAKFAEPRHSPEFDVLYDWPEIGTYKVGDEEEIKSHELVFGDVVQLINVGTDSLLVKGLYYEVIPKMASQYVNYTYSPNSSFGDPETQSGRNYGGGQNYRGRYPGALVIGGLVRRYEAVSLENKTLIVNGNSLSLPLPRGKIFKSLEIMCGDTLPDGRRNRDGGIGSSGDASDFLAFSIDSTNWVEKLYK